MNKNLFGEPERNDFTFAEGKCIGCGKKIVWGVDEHGTRIPLDPAVPIYTLSGFHAPNSGNRPAAEIARAKRDEFMCSHFVTCSKANQFSAGSRP